MTGRELTHPSGPYSHWDVLPRVTLGRLLHDLWPVRPYRLQHSRTAIVVTFRRNFVPSHKVTISCCNSSAGCSNAAAIAAPVIRASLFRV